MHVDTDESNAANLDRQTQGIWILSKTPRVKSKPLGKLSLNGIVLTTPYDPSGQDIALPGT
jgi:hypothetical protein